MMVTFVSQCEKKALNKTRRVLDAFANRIGDNTWQTVITQEGLDAVKKLLRKTATKNTAVSCHWIRSRSRSEFIWAVGNRNKFNSQGYVPVNYMEQEYKQYSDNYQWNTLQVIKYAAVIAGFFHDFGKSTLLFQRKIDPKIKTEKFEPYRHEWVSLRLFQKFVEDKSDEEWLEALSQIDKEQTTICFKDGLDGNVNIENHPIINLKNAKFGQLVAWLILTHHKLPLYPGWMEKRNNSPELKDIKSWLEGNFDAEWNSYNCKNPDQKDRVDENWKYSSHGLPYRSNKWCAHACVIASEASERLRLFLSQKKDWLHDQLFTSHLSRLCLMLADHYYSSQNKVKIEWRSSDYEVWANSSNGVLKQRVDEHLIGVAHYAERIAKALPKLNGSLSELGAIDFLIKGVEKEFKEHFGWQDTARKNSEKIASYTISGGFFGVNMASTGKGKTLANAKIMYALGNETGRKRFSVALGLRTLTLQTGREYRELLGLNDEELAIAVGGDAVKQLFENEQAKQYDNTYEKQGNESGDELLDKDLYVDYKGGVPNHSLSEWTKQEKSLENLINAPVLVCTIDHLIPATEGTKGGKQIASTLRLLSSDLILDEPDDFGLEDLPALCRLVHMAGLMGSRVLLSTATMPPALAYALFQAYRDGWIEYSKANIADWKGEICCAWFDDQTDGFTENCKDIKSYMKAHKRFISKRAEKLKANDKQKQKGMIVTVERQSEQSISECLAQMIQSNLLKLHKEHHQTLDGKTISIGLVRMANIDPLIAVSKKLLESDSLEPDTAIHYCVYHSRYPLAIRSYLESKLDRILNRKDPELIWKQPEIEEKIIKSSLKNHIFVVLASPVAEVGRDHDYDWAIVEPSSMRSIIQLAGRVLRHRFHVPDTPNILLLSKNFKALAGEDLCFVKPGFESIDGLVAEKSHDLFEILEPGQYELINAIPRITELSKSLVRGKSWSNLMELEHKALTNQLFIGRKPAKIWWKEHPHWCGEVQRQQRFRQSLKDEAYYLFVNDGYGGTPEWQWKNEHTRPVRFGDLSGISIDRTSLDGFGGGNDFWFDLDANLIYSQLAEELGIESLSDFSRKFGELRIVSYDNQQQEYKYHPNLGVFQERRS